MSSETTAAAQTATFSLLYQRGRYLPLEINGNCSSCGGGGDDEKYQFDGANRPSITPMNSGTR